MALLKNAIVVFTECYGPVDGELVVLDNEPLINDLTSYDHVVEGGLGINSGILRVLDCPNSALQLEVKVNPGKYRVRVSSANLDSLEGDEGDDYYKIQIWPSDDIERRVLKRYEDK